MLANYVQLVRNTTLYILHIEQNQDNRPLMMDMYV